MPLKPPGWHFKKRTLWVPVPASLFSLLKIALLSLLKDIKGSGSLLSLRVGKKKKQVLCQSHWPPTQGCSMQNSPAGARVRGSAPQRRKGGWATLSQPSLGPVGRSGRSRFPNTPCWQLSRTEVLPCAPTPPILLCPAVVWFCWLACREWMTLS